ncbi:MAG: S-layer homology domain-containing protein [Gemmatimonadaceae bacterium]|nr:S-layer homology domain-containing protein [Gloeobacterales cyanobacterium ES-bin-141]
MQAVLVLSLLLGLPLAAGSQTITPDRAPLPIDEVYAQPVERFENPFRDVTPGDWAYEAVVRMYYTGILKGYPSSLSKNPSAKMVPDRNQLVRP